MAPDGSPRGASGAFAAYPLDGLARDVRRAKVQCPELGFVPFAGRAVRFEPEVRSVPAFRERLLVLERIASEVAARVYGRHPSAILVAASYDCRPVTGNRRRLSEHALGNAIDVRGFRFAPGRAATPGAALPIPLDVGFEVSVAKHWKARGDAVARRHARFLAELTGALLAEDLFRTLLGPAHPEHHDHFHFDMAPSRFVNL